MTRKNRARYYLVSLTYPVLTRCPNVDLRPFLRKYFYLITFRQFYVLMKIKRFLLGTHFIQKCALTSDASQLNFILRILIIFGGFMQINAIFLQICSYYGRTLTQFSSR